MSVPIKTFTGTSGKGLGGTNGAGTVATGGLQRDLTTLFAMVNPEATRPDGQPGGIQKENLATNIWEGFLDGRVATENALGVVKVPADYIDTTGMMKFTGMLKLHADSGWQVNSTANSNIVWNKSSATAIYTFTFGTPFTSLSYPYIPFVMGAGGANGDGLYGMSVKPYNMTLTSCKLQTGDYYMAWESSQGNSTTKHYEWRTIASYFRILLFKII